MEHSNVMGRSARLVLRCLERADMEAYRNALIENEEWLRPWLPHPLPDPRSEEWLIGSIDQAREEWHSDTAYRAGLFYADELIGRVALSTITRGNFQNSYSGYWIAQKKAGCGLMPEAIVLSLKFAFEKLRLHRVQYAIMPHNQPSLRVMEKLDFRQEGHAQRYLQIAGAYQDHQLFAIIEEEWQARKEALLERFVSR